MKVIHAISYPNPLKLGWIGWIKGWGGLRIVGIKG